MNCPDVESKLSWYLDGEAPELEEHLAGCEACRAKLQEMGEADRLLSLAATRFQAEAASVKPVEFRPPAPRWKWGVLAVAAVALMAAIAWRLSIDWTPPRVPQVAVLGSAVWVEGTDGVVRVLVRDGKTLQAIAGAKVVAEIEGGAKVEGASGPDGVAELRVPAPAAKDAMLILTVITVSGEDRITRKVTIERPVRVLVSTDKPIYQPGQAVHIRALAMDDVRLVPFQGDVSLEIADANGNKVERKALKTSEFGIASFDLALADEVLLGNWTIKAVAGGAESERAFEVKRYVLPKFKVDLVTDLPFYEPGRTISADIDANYVYGKPCAGAEVRFTISQWVADEFRDEGTTVTKADEKGHVRVQLELPRRLVGLEVQGGDALVRCEAAVTDSAGHVERKALLIPVSSRPVRIVVVPEGGEYVPGIAQNMYVVCSYPDGRAARTKVRIKGAGEQRTDDNGVLEIPIPGPRFQLIAHDDEGRSGVLDADLEKDGVAQQDFLIRTDFPRYHSGQTMQLTVLSRTDGPIYVDLTRGPFTVLTKTVDVKSGRADVAIDLPAELRGSVRVSAYRVANDGRIWRDARPVVVLPARGLQVVPEIRREPFKPGEEVEARVRVLDPDGNPAPSAISASVVDEAVFALADSRPGLEATYFAIQEDLLKPRLQVRPAGALASSDPTPARLAIAEKPQATFLGVNEWALKYQRLLAEQFSRTHSAQEFLAWVVVLVLAIWTASLLPLSSRVCRVSFGLMLALIVGVTVLPPGADETPLFIAGAVTAFLVGLIAGGIEYRGSVPQGVAPLLGGSTVFAAAAVLTAWTRDYEDAAPIFAFLGLCCLIGACVVPLTRRETGGLARGVAIVGLILCGVAMPLSLATTKMSGRRLASMVPAGSADKNSMVIPRAARGPRESERAVFGDPVPLEDIGHEMRPLSDRDAAVARAGAGLPRLREFFPETLYWNPQIVTDNDGRATLRFPAADSITTWRVGLSAVDRGGRLGAADAPLRVFQPFFCDLDLPVALTQGDEAWLPVAVYNYLETEQTVELAFEAESGFELVDGAKKSLRVGANDVRSVSFHVKAKDFGRHKLQVTAKSAEFADAIRRAVDVVPDGREMPVTVNGALLDRASATVRIPTDAVDGSGKLFVRLYPNRVSEVVGGLEGLIRMPHGCFEQTSSTVWPNVLVRRYLEKSGRLTPEMKLKIDEAITAGYQRLATFEVKGGGFDWYGGGPAKTILTAYGVMEFADMARVRDVDPAIIARAVNVLWLRQESDGGWPLDANTHDWMELANGRLPLTAYVAWALDEAGIRDAHLDRARSYVAAHASEAKTPYEFALIALALNGQRASDLERTARREPGAASWEASCSGLVGARGSFANVEATALSALALERSRSALTSDALAWLTRNRFPNGDWGTTQGTILAIKALLGDEGSGRPPEKPVSVKVRVNGHEIIGAFRQVDATTFDLVQQAEIPVVEGDNVVELETTGPLAASFQVAGSYVLPWRLAPRVAAPPISIEVGYDAETIDLDGELHATAALTARGASSMVIADVGVPPGFEPDPATLEHLRDSGLVDKFAIAGNRITFYINALAPGKTLQLAWTLRPRFPVVAQTPASGCYEYYTPDNSGVAAPRRIVVRENK